MNYQAIAFFTGLFGGLHCVAMCGPLVMALPQGNYGWWFSLAQRILYQSGRIFTYSLLGLIAGFAGSKLQILGLQQLLSMVTGILLLAIAALHFAGKKATRFSNFQIRMVAPIASLMGRWLGKSYGGLFAGMLHGLLPCGMVYMALAASLNAGTPLDGSRFMFFFGLGTTPLLLLASALPLMLRRMKAPQALVPVLFVIAGFFLILRAVNLDIPYVSSPVQVNAPAACE